MPEEIIKTIIEMSLCGIAVYTGSAIYNWGYRTGVNSCTNKMDELYKTIEDQKERISELYEYIGRDYCINPFALHNTDKLIKQDHLHSEVKAKEVVYKGKKIKGKYNG